MTEDQEKRPEEQSEGAIENAQTEETPVEETPAENAQTEPTQELPSAEASEQQGEAPEPEPADSAQEITEQPAETEAEQPESPAAPEAVEAPESPETEEAPEAPEAEEAAQVIDAPAASEEPEAETAPTERATESSATEPAKAEEDADEKKPRTVRSRVPELTVLPDDGGSDKKWYVIHAHSGHENKVKQSLENRVRQERLEEFVTQVLVPSEEVAEVKGGKKRITNRKIFPGYVLVEMKLSHKTWFLVRTTPGVTGFIGSGKMPTPLDPEEVETIFKQMRGEQKKPKPKVEFEKDERVKIIEGPFTNFMGTVDEVNPERGKLKVMVEIFERLTSVELEFWQVEKL